jgi:hypothetical protein
VLVLICLQFSVLAQQPLFENLKIKENPFLQFNDVIEYNGKILFITNEGVYQFKNNEIKIINRKENLARFIKADNQLFIYSLFGNFYQLENGKLNAMSFNNLVSKRLENKIINRVIYNDNTFWISTVIGGGLIKIDQTNKEVKTITYRGEYPYYIAQFGKKFISGNNSTSSKKKLIVDFEESPIYISLAENLSFSKSNVLKLKDGTFIFTRQHEAIRFNSKKILNRIFIENPIETIYQSSDEKIWFTLNNGGVIRFNDGTFNLNSSTRYLGNKTVISIIQDHKGNMWFGTSGNGIYLQKNPIKLEYNPPKIFSATNSATEEIESILINSDLPLTDKNSKIIRTNAIKNDTTPPIVFINNIKINGKDTITLNYYNLSYNENNIEINISGIYGGKSELQYKYILEGRELDWNYSTSTSIHYTALPSGNYTFKVFAMSDGGVWSKVPAVVTFGINPPVYTSFWFIFSVIFLLLIVILIVVIVETRKAQKRKALFEEEKRKVLVSELQALRSQMNPHFIFNTLSSIQSFITLNSSKDAIHYLSKFSKLMRATLENTQKQKIPIKDEIETLELYMGLEKLRLNNKFNYSIVVKNDIDVQFEEIPPMLIQPYLENAIWHGISHKKNSGTIKVTFSLENEDLLKCTVKDDGVGRQKSRDLNKEGKKNKSLGMSITKDRLEIINSLKNSKLNINILDLEENGTSKGTKIELFIPLD